MVLASFAAVSGYSNHPPLQHAAVVATTPGGKIAAGNDNNDTYNSGGGGGGGSSGNDDNKDDNNDNDDNYATPGFSGRGFYNPANLVVLFAVMNGLLVLPAAVGFLSRPGSAGSGTSDSGSDGDNNNSGSSGYARSSSLLKVPLLLALAGSFSWMLFPFSEGLVADRWTILAGAFLSLFAAYGLIVAARRLLSLPASAAFLGSLLALFAIIGVGFAVMPYDSPFPLYAAARANIENFGPVTMQFSSLDVEKTGKMLLAIEWINDNTEKDAVIVGEKHWRGFMELNLADGREYRFSGNPGALAEALGRLEQRPVYFFSFGQGGEGVERAEGIERGDSFSLLPVGREAAAAVENKKDGTR